MRINVIKYALSYLKRQFFLCFWQSSEHEQRNQQYQKRYQGNGHEDILGRSLMRCHIRKAQSKYKRDYACNIKKIRRICTIYNLNQL